MRDSEKLGVSSHGLEGRSDNTMPGSGSYYQDMRQLAHSKRIEYEVQTATLNLQVIRRIYRAEGIKMDYWDTSTKIRAAYFCEDNDYSVLINRKLPREPKLFSLVHELKHHYADQSMIKEGEIRCGDYNANQTIEIAAEVFAAEFIYPESEMLALISELEITKDNCSPEKVVEFKRNCPAVVSYKFIAKRFEWFKLCAAGEYNKIKFQNLEETLHGRPFYKEEWFKRHRQAKRVRRI
jgi:Zn-dependent peptidase ImmA (M78 family)